MEITWTLEADIKGYKTIKHTNFNELTEEELKKIEEIEKICNKWKINIIDIIEMFMTEISLDDVDKMAQTIATY